MATYNDLKPGFYYLIKQSEHASIELVYIAMETSKCVLVEYQDEEQSMNWFKKTEPVAELVEKLTEEQAIEFEQLFKDDEEEDLTWPDDELQDDEWFGGDFDDDDDEEKRRALNN